MAPKVPAMHEAIFNRMPIVAAFQSALWHIKMAFFAESPLSRPIPSRVTGIFRHGPLLVWSNHRSAARASGGSFSVRLRKEPAASVFPPSILVRALHIPCWNATGGSLLSALFKKGASLAYIARHFDYSFQRMLTLHADPRR